MLSILAAILNIGDIRVEGETHPHIGEISAITNTDKINDGEWVNRIITGGRDMVALSNGCGYNSICFEIGVTSLKGVTIV